jgi:hypothetical protein
MILDNGMVPTSTSKWTWFVISAGVQMKPIQGFILQKKREVGLKIFIVQKDILPLVPPGDNMV